MQGDIHKCQAELHKSQTDCGSLRIQLEVAQDKLTVSADKLAIAHDKLEKSQAAVAAAEAKAAAAARAWAANLAERLEVPVRLVDERLSTVQAQRALQAGGRSTRQSRSLIDSASAVMVLQADLDREAAQCAAADGRDRGGGGVTA